MCTPVSLVMYGVEFFATLYNFIGRVESGESNIV